nr:winged helix-turn-helix transcriptional regulator [Staphylococcus hominis]
MDEFIFIIFIQLFSYHRFFQYRNIERIVYPVVPPKVEYKLTNIGKTLDKVVYAICDWGGDEFLEEISK